MGREQNLMPAWGRHFACWFMYTGGNQGARHEDHGSILGTTRCDNLPSTSQRRLFSVRSVKIDESERWTCSVNLGQWGIDLAIPTHSIEGCFGEVTSIPRPWVKAPHSSKRWGCTSKPSARAGRRSLQVCAAGSTLKAAATNPSWTPLPPSGSPFPSFN